MRWAASHDTEVGSSSFTRRRILHGNDCKSSKPNLYCLDLSLARTKKLKLRLSLDIVIKVGLWLRLAGRVMLKSDEKEILHDKTFSCVKLHISIIGSFESMKI